MLLWRWNCSWSSAMPPCWPPWGGCRVDWGIDSTMIGDVFGWLELMGAEDVLFHSQVFLSCAAWIFSLHSRQTAVDRKDAVGVITSLNEKSSSGSTSFERRENEIEMMCRNGNKGCDRCCFTGEKRWISILRVSEREMAGSYWGGLGAFQRRIQCGITIAWSKKLDFQRWQETFWHFSQSLSKRLL